MKTQQLQNFVEVIDCGSINKAAKKLYMTQPNVSRSIHSLEKEMGQVLLIRTNKGIQLTPAGQSLYFYAKSILTQFQMLDKLKYMNPHDLFNKLTISVDSIFLRDDLILLFYEQIKSANTEIHMFETTCEEVIENVSNLKSELGITVLNNHQLSVFKKMCELKDLEYEILDSGPLYVHLNENNPLANKDKINANDLLENTYIHLPYDLFSNINLSISVDNVQLSTFTRTLTMSNYHAIIHFIKNTNAFLCGHKWQIKELAKTHIKSLLVENCDFEMHLIIVKRKQNTFSDSASIFLEIFKQYYPGV